MGSPASQFKTPIITEKIEYLKKSLSTANRPESKTLLTLLSSPPIDQEKILNQCLSLTRLDPLLDPLELKRYLELPCQWSSLEEVILLKAKIDDPTLVVSEHDQGTLEQSTNPILKLLGLPNGIRILALFGTSPTNLEKFIGAHQTLDKYLAVTIGDNEQQTQRKAALENLQNFLLGEGASDSDAENHKKLRELLHEVQKVKPAFKDRFQWRLFKDSVKESFSFLQSTADVMHQHLISEGYNQEKYFVREKVCTSAELTKAQKLLEKFGLTQLDIDYLLNESDHVKELIKIANLIPDDVLQSATVQSLLHWSVLVKNNLQSEVKPSKTDMERTLAMSDKVVLTLWALLNFLDLAVTTLACFPRSHAAKVLNPFAYYNIADTSGELSSCFESCLLGIEHYRAGNNFQASVFAVEMGFSLGLGITTAVGSSVGLMSYTMAASFLAFGAGVSMLLSSALEWQAADKCQKRIIQYQGMITSTDPNIRTEQKIIVSQLALVELAELKDHQNLAKLWSACGLTLIVIGVISLSAFSFGTPLILAGVMVGLTLASIAFEAVILKGRSGFKNLKNNAPLVESWHTLLANAIDYLNDNGNETSVVKEQMQWIYDNQNKMADLVVSNPEKAQRIIKAFNEWPKLKEKVNANCRGSKNVWINQHKDTLEQLLAKSPIAMAELIEHLQDPKVQFNEQWAEGLLQQKATLSGKSWLSFNPLST